MRTSRSPTPNRCRLAMENASVMESTSPEPQVFVIFIKALIKSLCVFAVASAYQKPGRPERDYAAKSGVQIYLLPPSKRHPRPIHLVCLGGEALPCPHLLPGLRTPLKEQAFSRGVDFRSGVGLELGAWKLKSSRQHSPRT